MLLLTIALLLVALIIVVLFREEIKALIGLGVCLFIVWGAWRAGGLWRLFAILLVAFIVSFIVQTVRDEWRRDRKPKSDSVEHSTPGE